MNQRHRSAPILTLLTVYILSYSQQILAEQQPIAAQASPHLACESLVSGTSEQAFKRFIQKSMTAIVRFPQSLNLMRMALTVELVSGEIILDQLATFQDEDLFVQQFFKVMNKMHENYNISVKSEDVAKPGEISVNRDEVIPLMREFIGFLLQGALSIIEYGNDDLPPSILELQNEMNQATNPSEAQLLKMAKVLQLELLRLNSKNSTLSQFNKALNVEINSKTVRQMMKQYKIHISKYGDDDKYHEQLLQKISWHLMQRLSAELPDVPSEDIGSLISIYTQGTP